MNLHEADGETARGPWERACGSEDYTGYGSAYVAGRMHYAGISLYDPVQFGVVILTVILDRAVPITIAAAPRGPVDVYAVSGLCSLTFRGHLTHVELLFNVLDSEVTVGESLQSTHFYAFVAPFTGLTHEYQCLYPTSRCFCLGCPPILIHHQGRYARKHRREPRNW